MEASLGVHNHIGFPKVVVIVIININIIAFLLCPTSLLPETQVIPAFLKAGLPGEAKASVNSWWTSGLAECPLQGQGEVNNFIKTKKPPLDFSLQKCLDLCFQSIIGINLPLEIREVTD